MSELKQCPCGKVPTDVGFTLTQGTKWMDVYPDCCGEWTIETRTHYERDEMALKKLAADAWNSAPRGWEPTDALGEEDNATGE